MIGKITPGFARWLLSLSDKNRILAQPDPHVARLVCVIQSGSRFHEAIILNSDGTVVDGLRRLHAIVEADLPTVVDIRVVGDGSVPDQARKAA